MTDTPQKPIHTIHDAVTQASAEPKTDVKLETSTYKVAPEKKATASTICLHNGTTLSGYLRKCVDLLVEDYGGDVEAH